jgi:hypothetical protein
MPCLIGCLALSAPRVALALVWLFSDVLQKAYDSLLWPVLGFLFMPVTTLAYAWAKVQHGTIEGGWLALVIVAVLVDLGLFRSGTKRREKAKD